MRAGIPQFALPCLSFHLCCSDSLEERGVLPFDLPIGTWPERCSANMGYPVAGQEVCKLHRNKLGADVGAVGFRNPMAGEVTFEAVTYNTRRGGLEDIDSVNRL